MPREQQDALPDHELLDRWRTHHDTHAAEELRERHGPALYPCLTGLPCDPATTLRAILRRVRDTTSSRAELAQPTLLICRVALELLDEIPDDTLPLGEPPLSNPTEQQLLELALQRIAPRDRAVLLLHHHILAATHDLDPADVDPRITTRVDRARARLHDAIELLRTP